MIIASIDIGTNTVLLLIAEVKINENILIPILNESRIPRIGKGLLHGGEILSSQSKLMFDVLDDYFSIIANYNCERVLVTATNAFRIASNGNALLKRIKLKYNCEAKIIPGREEAKYSYLGATFNNNSENINLVIDIGGGSTELVFGCKSNILFSKSFLVGVVSGTEMFLKHSPPSATELACFTNELIVKFDEVSNYQYQVDSAIAIAGTPTALACIKQNLSEFNEESIEGSILAINEIRAIAENMSRLTSNDISEKYGAVVNGRDDILLAGALILEKIMDIMNITSVSVSTKGIRYGAIVNLFPNK